MSLSGLKVVELATWIAAPGCAAMMADWGADVIKIESAGGDPVRHVTPTTDERGNAVFAMENRGKRSVVLDIGSEAGRGALLALLREADVFVTNLRPGSLTRAGLDHASIAAIAPRLVYASISGQGSAGPDADLPAFDITGFWTRGGVAASTIPPDQSPFPCRPGFGDHVTALATLSGIMAALYERERTGRGRLIETSLLRTATYAMGWDLALQLRDGAVVTAQPRDQWPSPISGYFRTADARWIYVAPRGPACLGTALRAVGHGELADDPGLTAIPPDLDRVREIRALVDAAYAAMTLAEAEALLRTTDLIWAPMATLADVAQSPQAEAAGCFVELAGGGRSPAGPVGLGAKGARPEPPRLGEHSETVLAGLAGGGWPVRG